jgi:hypothetical protein
MPARRVKVEGSLGDHRPYVRRKIREHLTL